ncbi:MAG: basic rane protein [Thermoleophilaceae bacterium]|nr:basic rane protein [Thermoleophilaceae bacterium]
MLERCWSNYGLSRAQRRLPVLCTLALVVLALVAAGCGGDDSGASKDSGGSADKAEKTLKVSSLHLGTLENHFAQAASEGIKDAAAKTDGVDVDLVTGVDFNQQAGQTADQLLTRGADVVIDNLTLGDILNKACEKHADAICLTQLAWDGRGTNVGGWYPDSPQAYYVEGVAGGLLTKTNTVGFIGTFAQNYEFANINSVALGCQAVNPDCEVRVVYINSFYDPAKANEAANTLIDAGADVLYSYESDPAHVKVAQKRGARAFGQYLDETESGPDAIVTSMLAQPAHTAYLSRTFAAIKDGSYKIAFEDIGFDKGLELAPWNANVPADVVEKADAVKKQFADGKSEEVYSGPIYDQKGELKLKKGESLDDHYRITSWDYLVKGVIAGQ